MKKEELWNQVEAIHEGAKEKIVGLISKLVKEDYCGVIEFKDAEINEADKHTIFVSLFYDTRTKEIMLSTIFNGVKQYDNIFAFRVNDLIKLVDFIKLNSISKYKWIVSSDDDCFIEESKTLFRCEKEAYDDMRNAALEKMKWNTEYGDIPQNHDLDEDYIGYSVKFFKDKIIHESYSGIYTYNIVKVG